MENQPEKRSPQPTGPPAGEATGPRFGLDYEGGWGKKTKGWINRYGSSVILPIIALLILAGGIYLYASQTGEEVKVPLKNNTASVEELTLSSDGEPIIAESASDFQKPETQEVISKSRKEGGEFVEKAVKGEGVTHLARRALKNYLESNSQELTNEHKVYIEDYLKDKAGSRPLEVGEEIAFSQDLIEEAIDASLNLDLEQLRVLEQYSQLVAW